MDDLIGKTISGRYQVEAFLGKGGMAEVYKVWDKERSVHLAMKILHADLAEDRVFLRRFKREAQTLAKLQHPNIVRFYGLEQADRLVFILMDYVDGTNLRKEIFEAGKPFTQERITELMRPICAALHYAHKSGFVHCDVKPANIMIEKGGKVYVSDFGIARMTEASTVTMVGAGTPAYMAPEQVRGEDPLPQTDIYALGIVLFEMLTGGERPFTGESAKTSGSTSEKVRWEQTHLPAPPPSKFNPSVTPEMDAIVLKCLEKLSSKRYMSATDLFGGLAMQNVPVPSFEPIKRKDAGLEESPAQPIPASRPSTQQPQVVQPDSRHITQSLKAPWVIGVGVLLILIVATISTGIVYRNKINTTATANAMNMEATVFSQYITSTAKAYSMHTTATEQAIKIQSTANSMYVTATAQELQQQYESTEQARQIKEEATRHTQMTADAVSTVTVINLSCPRQSFFWDGKYKFDLDRGGKNSFTTTRGSHTVLSCNSTVSSDCGSLGNANVLVANYTWTISCN